MKQVFNLPKFLSVLLFKKFSTNKTTINYNDFIENYIKNISNKSNAGKLF